MRRNSLHQTATDRVRSQGTTDTPEQESIIRVTDLVHRVHLERNDLTILQGIELDIKRGESVAIVGRSGSGKTTLLGLLAGLDTPTEGRVELAGHPISAWNEDQRATLRAEMVGFIFQSFQLLPALSALENVMLPLELQNDKNARTVATELLQRVGLGERLAHSPRQLSGGEQQRVAIARAFAARPVVLFADEPTGNLDNSTGQQIADLLMALNREEGTTLILVTHDERLAGRCARQVHIEGGRLLESAPADAPAPEESQV